MCNFCLNILYFLRQRDKDRERERMSQPPNGYRTFCESAITADTSLASTVGRDILRMGGNAVDAAIATLICSGLTSPQSMGIGGGFFMTIYDSANDNKTFIDAREAAPAGVDAGQPLEGPLRIAVPGEIKGYWYAHRKYGRLPWSDLFQPSIKFAEKGFPVPIGLQKALTEENENVLANEPLREIFFNKQTGGLYKENEIIKMPRLATTLKDIAEHGDDSFHNGSFTDDLVTDLREIGSIITRDDLQGYTVQEKQPVEITLKCGTRVISPPAPGGGPVLSLILNILDGYGLTKNDIDSVENRTRTCHRFIETLKMAYQECHQHCNDGKPLEEIISEDVANHLRSSINDKQIVELIKESANVKRRSACTSHVSVLDKNGLAVSVTSTINSRFGSGLVGKKTGIIFNNEMDDFSHPGQKGGMYSSPVNYVASGNRPLSSMCPAILVDSRGKVTYILGAAGGSMITSTVAWIAAHFLWFEKDLDQAVSMPRLHFDYATATVQYEEKFEKVIIDNLKKMGHILKVFHPGASISQGIEVKGQMIHAKSDQRKGGQPDGI